MVATAGSRTPQPEPVIMTSGWRWLLIRWSEKTFNSLKSPSTVTVTVGDRASGSYAGTSPLFQELGVGLGCG